MSRYTKSYSRSDMNGYMRERYGREMTLELRELFLCKNNNKLMFALRSKKDIFVQASNYILKKDIRPEEIWFI